MRVSRYWMTGCMALVLLAAQQAPARQQRVDADSTRRGLLKLTSKYNLDETISKIENAARQRGLPVLAIVAPRQSALDNSDKPASTQVLVLGDEGGTTPVVQSTGDQGIELPLKVVVAQQPDGSTAVEISDPAALGEANGLPEQMVQSMAAMPDWVDAALS